MSFTADPSGSLKSFITTHQATPIDVLNMSIGDERTILIVLALSAHCAALGSGAYAEPSIAISKVGGQVLINGLPGPFPIGLSAFPGPNPWTATLIPTLDGVKLQVTGDVGTDIDWRTALVAMNTISTPDPGFY